MKQGGDILKHRSPFYSENVSRRETCSPQSDTSKISNWKKKYHVWGRKALKKTPRNCTRFLFEPYLVCCLHPLNLAPTKIPAGSPTPIYRWKPNIKMMGDRPRPLPSVHIDPFLRPRLDLLPAKRLNVMNGQKNVYFLWWFHVLDFAWRHKSFIVLS